MIDSGPQLAGSMEYNVVLSECLSHVLGRCQATNRRVKITVYYIDYNIPQQSDE